MTGKRKSLTGIKFPFQEDGATVHQRSEVENNTITIPELEELVQNYVPKHRDWTEREIAIVRKYYKKVPTEALEKALPGRSINTIRQTAQRYGIK